MRKMKRIIAALVAGAVLVSGSFPGAFPCRVMAAESEQDLRPAAEYNLGDILNDPELSGALKELIVGFLTALAGSGDDEAAVGPETGPDVQKEEADAQRPEKTEEELAGELPVEWDLTDLYADEDAFNAEMDYLSEHAYDVEKYRGTLNNVDAILAITEDEEILELDSIYYRAAMYTQMLTSLDASDPWAKQASARFQEASARYMMGSAFVEPEIMALPLSEREKIFSDERLEPYAWSYHKYVDPDRVTLSEETIQAETLLNQATSQIQSAYSVFDNVDNKRPEITYPDGTTGTLTDAAYSNIMQSTEYDHDFRREANILRESIREPYQNTYAELLAGVMKRNWAEAQLHGYDSTLEYISAQDDLDPELFYRIIEFSHSLMPKLHEYFAATKEMLGLEEMGSYDIGIPFNEYEPPEMPYEDCVKLGREAVKFWGDEYIDRFDSIITSGHIDVYPSDTKDTGAYEMLYGGETLPYVMFNFDGLMDYTSTIVHEMGHAVYSEFSAENQNMYYSMPGAYNQEVASTANELIFFKYLIDNASDEDEKKYWIAREITLFFNTIIWQCVLAEFEDYCYKTIEAGNALSAEAMNEKFYELIKNMYGEDMLVEPYIGVDWARISHFYSYCYYVYKYATSLTFATAICNKALEDEGEKENYLEYLKAGASASPEDLLRIAGVDPSDPDTYETAKDYFEDLVDQFVEQ